MPSEQAWFLLEFPSSPFLDFQVQLAVHTIPTIPRGSALAADVCGWWLAGMCLLLLGGCASAPATLTLAQNPAMTTQLWPAPPDVPRYRYAGELIGESNFVRDDAAEKGLTKFVRWLVGLVGSGTPTVLQRPQTGMVDDKDRVYVTDASRAAVYVFDAVKGVLDVWERADEQGENFVSPVGIAPGPGGTVFVADAELGFVAHFDAKGEPIGKLGAGILRRPTGLAWDAARQRLYVADTHAHDIKIFAANGTLLGSYGERGEALGELNFPTHLTLAGGDLYVTDTMNNRIQVFDVATGRGKRAIGQRGLFVGNLVRPKGVAVDADGNVYVVESYYDHLLVFDRDGQFLMPIGGTGKETGSFYLPTGVWVDTHNRVYVADMMNGRITVFQFLGGEHAK